MNSPLVSTLQVYARERDLVRTCLRYMNPTQRIAVRDQIEALDRRSEIWCLPGAGPSGALELWDGECPVREVRHA